MPVGSGFILYGVNDNLISNNNIYDNWRSGVRLFWVPAAIRGENDPAKQFDTSNGNKFMNNQLGYDAGRRQPNGTDFFWDENGVGNCWAGNFAPGAQDHQRPGDRCRGARRARCCHTGNTAKLAAEAPCATWDPRDNPDPPGCTWFTTPPKPTPMRWWVAAIVLLLAGVGALLLLGDRDGGTTQAATDTARLQWKEKPSLILVPELPRDRILTGQLRNASLRAVDLDSERVADPRRQGAQPAGHGAVRPELLARALPVVDERRRARSSSAAGSARSPRSSQARRCR